jgi:hypothetical protein
MITVSLSCRQCVDRNFEISTFSSQIVSVTLQYKEKYFLSAGTQKFKAPFNISF